MKATGIVRRIDDLGRVVIPKEIRKTLRIREGDPLEIYTDNNGEIILKRYSPIEELGEFAKEYADALSKTSGHTACITDKNYVIAVAGGPKKEYFDKPLSEQLEKVIEGRKNVVASAPDGQTINIVENEPDKHYTAQVITPIIAEGDTIGSVIFLSTDPKVHMSDVEIKLAESAAGFLGRQMEH